MPETVLALDRITDASYVRILEKIDETATNLLTRTPERIAHESKIIAIITETIEKCCKLFTIHQYGSTAFGFGGSVDLNLLVQICEH